MFQDFTSCPVCGTVGFGFDGLNNFETAVVPCCLNFVLKLMLVQVLLFNLFRTYLLHFDYTIIEVNKPV